jgi:hypothetical protein
MGAAIDPNNRLLIAFDGKGGSDRDPAGDLGAWGQALADASVAPDYVPCGPVDDLKFRGLVGDCGPDPVAEFQGLYARSSNGCVRSFETRRLNEKEVEAAIRFHEGITGEYQAKAKEILKELYKARDAFRNRSPCVV